jgi:hypothetical protein
MPENPVDESTTALAPGPSRAEPDPMRENWRMATAASKSDLVPKAFRGHPEDAFVAIQNGADAGVKPMTALQGSAVIGSRPEFFGDLRLGLIMASPLYEDHDEYFVVNGDRRDSLTPDDLKLDTTAAVCTFVRRGKPLPVTRRFSVAQAKKAQLLGKEGAWQTFPDRMLQMRARSFAARDCFPDVLKGVSQAADRHQLPTETAPPRVVRRLSTPPVVVTDPAAPALVTLAAVKIGSVEVAIHGYSVTLTDGRGVLADETAALELEKWAGTDHELTLTCDPADGALRVVSWLVTT